MKTARSDGREARLGTANPATRVQIPFRPPFTLINPALTAEYSITTASPSQQSININESSNADG